MQARTSPIVDQILDRYLLSSEEVREVRDMVYGLGVEQGVEKIGAVLNLSPHSRRDDVERLARLDATGFGFDIAQTFLDRINQVTDPDLQRNASEKLGEIIQYSSLDIWESVKAYKPDFIKNLLVGFKRYNARSKGKNNTFFQSMGVGYLYREAEDFRKAGKKAGNSKESRTQAPPLPGPTEVRIEKDLRRIAFNPRHKVNGRKKRFYTLMADYGYMSPSNIKGFFEAEYQFGYRVQCPGEKRNHIALLFDRLITEEMLIVTGGKGHWKVLENCFVDESRNSLSNSFSKLLSKLRKEEDKKPAIFAEIEEIIHDLKK